MKYEWDYDYNGSDFDADAEGVMSAFTYTGAGSRGIHMVAVRVTDNNIPALNDIVTQNVELSFTNSAPSADAEQRSIFD
jgi:hypothetical protein